MNADWFYSVGDTRQGPVTEDDLKALAADGRLKPSDLVWRDGMADWVEARTVPALFPAPKVEPLRDDDDRPSRRRLDDDRPSRRGRDEFDDDRPSRRGRRDADLDDDRPSRRGRREAEVDDDRPRVRRRDDDYDRYEDDGYDRPKKPQKPGQVQAVGIMMLVGGILGLLLVLTYLPATMCIILVWPPIYLELVVGILMIIRGVNMMNQDDQGPPRTLAILQILFILNLDVINCVLGIVSLIMLNDPKVEEYYRRRGF